MRGRLSRWLHSLVTRTLLVGLLVILVGTATRMYILSGLLRTEINTSMQSQQHELALHAAHGLAQKIQLRQDSVQRLARSLPQEVLARPAALREWLQQRSELLAQFPSGLWVEQADGNPIAAYPALQLPFKALQPADTGQPQTGYLGRDATVVVSALLRGGDGRVLGVLRGASTPKALGLFEPVQNYQNGRNGSYLLVFPR